jgi:hypothetical protein
MLVRPFTGNSVVALSDKHQVRRRSQRAQRGPRMDVRWVVKQLAGEPSGLESADSPAAYPYPWACCEQDRGERELLHESAVCKRMIDVLPVHACARQWRDTSWSHVQTRPDIPGSKSSASGLPYESCGRQHSRARRTEDSIARVPIRRRIVISRIRMSKELGTAIMFTTGTDRPAEGPPTAKDRGDPRLPQPGDPPLPRGPNVPPPDSSAGQPPPPPKELLEF